jgi:hypothetical protein
VPWGVPRRKRKSAAFTAGLLWRPHLALAARNTQSTLVPHRHREGQSMCFLVQLVESSFIPASSLAGIKIQGLHCDIVHVAGSSFFFFFGSAGV